MPQTNLADENFLRSPPGACLQAKAKLASTLAFQWAQKQLFIKEKEKIYITRFHVAGFNRTEQNHYLDS